MRIFVYLVLVALAASGCGQYRQWDAVFVIYNTSSDNIRVFVNDGDGYEVLAEQPAKVKVPILVPKPAYNSGFNSSTVDDTVRVSVAVRNLRTGGLSAPIFCTAGAKVITTVWYEAGRIRCSSAY